MSLEKKIENNVFFSLLNLHVYPIFYAERDHLIFSFKYAISTIKLQFLYKSEIRWVCSVLKHKYELGGLIN